MYIRKLPTSWLTLKVGMGMTSLFPSIGLREAGLLEIRNKNIFLRVIYRRAVEKEVKTLLKKVKMELENNFRIENCEADENPVDGDLFEKIGDFAYEDSKKHETERPMYLVVTEKGSKDDPGAPYYRIKSCLISKRILSQVVTMETLKDSKKMMEPLTFRNIALGILVKANNIPWYLQRPVTLENDSEETLIIGVGITSIRKNLFSKEAYRYVGYFSFYNSRGIWKRLNPLFSSLDEISYRIKQTLSDGVEETISKGVNRLDVIIHYAGKEIKRQEEEVIRETLNQYAEKTGIKINHAIVRLIKSPVYRLFSNHKYGYAPMGTYVDFENRLVLIGTTGLLGRKATPIGVNTPILASVRDTNIEVNPQLIYNIVHSIVGLARMNWRGANAFNFEPATTKYAREIAYVLARLGESVYKDSETLKFIQNKMWFI